MEECNYRQHLNSLEPRGGEWLVVSGGVSESAGRVNKLSELSISRRMKKTLSCIVFCIQLISDIPHVMQSQPETRAMQKSYNQFQHDSTAKVCLAVQFKVSSVHRLIYS